MATKGKLASNPSKKIFVLDTSVILYDHDAINNFHEHDVAIPIQVLEELDNFKSGNDTRNFEARSFIRLIDQTSKQKLISDWVALKAEKAGMFRVVFNEKPLKVDAEEVFGKGKTDHKILNAALSLKEENPDKKVVLVSKDICLRLKAKALDLFAEDYETGKIKNVDELYAGKTELTNFSEVIIDEVKKGNIINTTSIDFPFKDGNHFYVLKNKRKTANVFYNHNLKTISSVSIDTVFKIRPKNIEQAFAIHALLDPEIKLVSIQGNAGTGKTLLAIASALEQRKNFRQIYVTRPIVSLSNKDIGFLPGDAKSKIDPFMAPIWDNLRFIKEQFIGDDKMSEKIDELITTEKIAIAPLAFIRGRTLTKIFFIIDEAQNLTPHEVKTIISRAGEHTKIVFTGDIYQIDTPYLDSESNGLSYLIENAKNHPLYAHITLQKGERSELANLANELL
ncbi:PhoH family protein [Pedobacter chinensis]|uniref:PhoH family protein n=1 Tax=Pedobacter chinensis TaxID=2282421 RepID=A0A369PZK5_9SPHI|nr:PhoH family protein [Pedobacter chinensis]RDC57672.1 PhoH family protein [Pedobacter chinensis]